MSTFTKTILACVLVIGIALAGVAGAEQPKYEEYRADTLRAVEAATEFMALTAAAVTYDRTPNIEDYVDFLMGQYAEIRKEEQEECSQKEGAK